MLLLPSLDGMNPPTQQGEHQMVSFNTQTLSNEEIRKLAPAVFAEAPHSKLSEKYSLIRTIDVIEALRSEGWRPTYAAQSKVRDTTRHGLQRHVIRLRHADVALNKVGDNFAEIVLTNSHDGSTGYNLHAGVFRLVCGNGLVVADTTFQRAKIRHTGVSIDQIVEASFDVAKALPEITGSIEGMRSTVLAQPEREAFARAAAMLRWPREEEVVDGVVVPPAPLPIEPTKLLTARRYEDNKADLWTTMNTVQENVIRGGVKGTAKTGRKLTTRAVGSVAEDTRLNKAIWHLAEEMRRIKIAG